MDDVTSTDDQHNKVNSVWELAVVSLDTNVFVKQYFFVFF